MSPIDLLALSWTCYAPHDWCDTVQRAAYAHLPFRDVNRAYYAGCDRDTFLELF